MTPEGLLIVKPKASNVISADQRLVASFQEINDFVKENGKEPQLGGNIKETMLYQRLKGMRENQEKSSALQSYDEHKLIDIKLKEIKSIDDILNDDSGILDSDAESIFNIKFVPKETTMPDYVAKRKPGYTRILKNSCRARHRSKILPNIYDKKNGANPRAKISYLQNGAKKNEVKWKTGENPHPILSAISVFDRECGTVHVSKKIKLLTDLMVWMFLILWLRFAKQLKKNLKKNLKNLNRRKIKFLHLPQQLGSLILL